MISKNGVALIAFALSYLGFQASEQDIAQFAAALIQIVSFVTMLYNQLDRRDVKGFLWKK